MEKEQHAMDELFRVVLKDQEVPPPADAWNNIEKALDSKKRVRFLWTIRALAATLALLATFASGYFIAKYTNHSYNSSIKPNSLILSSPNQIKANSNQIKQNNTSTKQESQAISDKHFNGINEPSQISNLQASEDKSTEIPIIVTSPVREDLRLAFLLPLKGSLKVNDIDQPATALLEFHLNHVNDISGEEIFLTEADSVNESNRISSRWSMGGQVSPLYAFRQTSTPGLNKAMANSFGNSSGPNESGIISYSGGMNVEFKASRRLSVSSGLYYSRMGQNIKGSGTSANFYAAATYSRSDQTGDYAFQNSTGILPQSKNTAALQVTGPGTKNLNSNILNYISTGQDATLLQSMDFLEIPLMVRYRIIDRKIGLHVLGGLSTHILTANKLVLEDSSGKQDYGSTSGLSTFNYSSTVGLGLDYFISKRIQLNLEPAFKYYINSMNSTGNIASHPYSFGIYTGMCYTF